MRTLRLAFRSYRTFYDRIWVMLLVTAVWWIMLPTIVLAPPATLLLFRHADPRIGSGLDRPNLRESSQIIWSELVRGWLITVVTLPLLALMAFNLTYYGGGDSALSFLAPIWLALLILGATTTIVIFALAGVTDLSPRVVVAAGARLTGLRLPAALLNLGLTIVVPVLLIIGSLYILLPLGFMIPGIAATAFSNFVLRATGTPIPDPNQPTAERLHEESSRG